jgi:hypothetical protein
LTAIFKRELDYFEGKLQKSVLRRFYIPWQRLMRAVAIRHFSAALAGTPGYALRICDYNGQRLEGCALMRAIAEGLIGAVAAGTVGIDAGRHFLFYGAESRNPGLFFRIALATHLYAQAF